MIPYGRQSIDEDDIAAVVEVLRGDFLTTGPKIQEFEEALCGTTGSDYAVACSNGTTALHLAGLALDLQEGDSVIVPSLTFLATANAVRHCGAEIVFADVNPETGLMEVQHLEEALSRCENQKAKAVFPVHLTGQCVDLKAMKAFTKERGIKIVADSCHALGGVYNDKSVGACEYEDLSTFSFHPVKTIAMGEGGAVTTNSLDYADKMRRLRNHGMVKNEAQGPWAYEMQELGHNYRVTDIQCALGISQLKKLERFVARRRELVALYDNLLPPLAQVVLPPEKVNCCDPAWHLYAVRIDFEQTGMARAQLMTQLADEGVGTQVHYIPVHTQPYYKKRYGDVVLPGATHYYGHTLSLPLYPSMKDSDVSFVVEQLKKAIGVG
ncbi:MAG: UDP-4-amino-4,6-dideoxy-N-acetyl-beta-L-altrosami ne transaminase [Micavibrio sp.]|nr:MAG: UDP-4-amino-4,6-dideoxy-N-acetyl-beta-L-altrosami ne transaminase [Micavibrio sp.]